MKDVKPEDMMPEDDVKLELEKQGLTLAKYVKLLKSEVSAMETKTFHNKDIIPELKKCPLCQGEQGNKKCKLCKGNGYYKLSPVIYSKNLKAWKIRQDARRDLGQHYGVESAAESKANLTIEVVQFKKKDCKESNTD